MKASTANADPWARRRAAGATSREQTRARLLDAADSLFRERGYAATTVSAIAERAGVSLQTLYLAWGSKSALYRAAADAAVTAAGMPPSAEQWREQIAGRLEENTGADRTAAAYLTEVARLFTEVASRSAVYWRMQPEAAVDLEVAAGHRQAMLQRRETLRQVAANLPSDGLRPEHTDDYRATTLWALASPQMYEMLTGPGAHDDDEFCRWLTETLLAALCIP